MQWIGSEDLDLVNKNNHLHHSSIPMTGSTGTSIGGDTATLFAGAAMGDFAPDGDLLSNRSTPTVKYDRTGKKRGTQTPAGSDS
jgi:hypothetical protein